MKRILFFVLVIIGIASAYWFTTLRGTTKGNIIPSENWRAVLIGKWDYHSVEEIDNRSKRVITGTLEFRDDDTYEFQLSEEYYKWYMDNFISASSETIGGSITGKWNVSAKVIKLTANSCSLQHGQGSRIMDSTDCYGKTELWYGEYKGENNIMWTFQFEDDFIRFKEKIFSRNAENVITLTKE